MKLYYAETLNPRKVCAVARYLNSPVEFVRVDLSKRENRTPAFLALNPNGKVPVLELDGRSLWEANAIMCYLARRAQSDLCPADERQIDVIGWLNWSSEHFSPLLSIGGISNTSSRLASAWGAGRRGSRRGERLCANIWEWVECASARPQIPRGRYPDCRRLRRCGDASLRREGLCRDRALGCAAQCAPRLA